MSAYLVSRAHIDALVTLGQLKRCIPLETRTFTTDMGKVLIRENIASIEARYPRDAGKPDQMPGEYTDPETYEHSFRPAHARLTPAQGLKAIAGYEYQACEHEGWKDSRAAQFCENLRHTLISALPGYEDAAWEITS